ncbi:MAG: YchJ family protein [Propionibacteriaceae bacterium]
MSILRPSETIRRRPTQCPCGGGSYDDCCGPLHEGSRLAHTAEELMRSRYCAFAVRHDDYLFRTWHPKFRPHIVATDDTAWTGLEILDVLDGGPHDQTGIVEFIAHYDGGQVHERSTFSRRAGCWMYEEAV